MQHGERPDDGIQDPHDLFLFRQQGTQSANDAGEGAHAHEAGMAQREQAGEAIDQVERQGQDGVDEDQFEDVDLIVAHIGLGLGQGQTEDDDKRDVEQGRLIEAH